MRISTFEWHYKYKENSVNLVALIKILRNKCEDGIHLNKGYLEFSTIETVSAIKIALVVEYMPHVCEAWSLNTSSISLDTVSVNAQDINNESLTFDFKFVQFFSLLL